MDSKSQRNGVQNELKRLREAQVARSQRDKLKDVSCSALTTPEEAHQFLHAMREKQHERQDITSQAPAHLSQDGMNAWYLQQRAREQQLREQRRQAETLLRNYRGTHLSSSGATPHSNSNTPRGIGSEGLPDPQDQAGSEVGVSPSSQFMGSFSGLHPTASASPSMGSSVWETRSGVKPGHKNVSDYWEEKKESHEPSRRTPVGQSNIGGYGFLSPPLPDGLATSTTTPNHPPPDHARHPNNVRGGGRGLQISTQPPPVETTPETTWRDFVSSKPGSKFTPEPGRYHLYGSYACPGSHRALIVRALKGLEEVISVTYLHPVWRLTNRSGNSQDKHRGWVFGNTDPEAPAFSNTIGKGGPFPPAYDDNEPDPSNVQAFSIREIYEYAKDTSGKYTIPLLWDTKLKTIVNNESSDIAYMLNSCFNDYARNPTLDLYTEDDVEEKAKLYQVSEWLSPLMIHGVYRCGFAKTQWAYDRAINDLCAAFDRADDTLEQQRYLTGDTLTDVDIRLFVTLLRFDEVYTVYFKANARLVMLTPSLLNFCRDIYQMPGVAETCHMEQIKAHFFASHAEWNKYSVIPRGLGFMELLDMPHDRHLLVEGGGAPTSSSSFLYHGEQEPQGGLYHGASVSNEEDDEDEDPIFAPGNEVVYQDPQQGSSSHGSGPRENPTDESPGHSDDEPKDSWE